MPWSTIATAGAGLVLGGGKAIADGKKADRQRQLQASTDRYSPWTGMHGQPVQEPDPFGTMMQGGVGGLAQGQSMMKANSDADTQDAFRKYLGSQTPANPGQSPGIVPMSFGPSSNSGDYGKNLSSWYGIRGA